MGGFFSHIFHVVGWCDSLYYLFPFFFINLHVFARILLSLLIPMATVTFTFTTFSLPFLLLKIARCVSRRMFVCEKQQQDERRRKKMHIAFPFGIQHSSSKQTLAIFFFVPLLRTSWIDRGKQFACFTLFVSTFHHHRRCYVWLCALPFYPYLCRLALVRASVGIVWVL